MSEPSPHGLIAALQALWGGAITTLVAALAGRLPTVAAAALSFMLAAAVNYRVSSQWVFQRDWRHAAQALRFMLFALAGLGINAGVTAWLATPLGLLAAKACGIATAVGVNFMMNARWVFHRRVAASRRSGASWPQPK